MSRLDEGTAGCSPPTWSGWLGMHVPCGHLGGMLGPAACCFHVAALLQHASPMPISHL